MLINMYKANKICAFYDIDFQLNFQHIINIFMEKGAFRRR